jgi:flagellar assembly protein FliH
MAISQRLVRDVRLGEAVGADGVGRYLSPEQRALLIGLLSDDAQEQASGVVADADTRAATIVAEAQAQAEAIRLAARADGYAVGRTEGEADARTAMEPYVALLQAASEEGNVLRAALIATAEQQTVALAIGVARRIVGAAVEAQAGLAAELVRGALRSAGAKVLRIQAHEDDIASIQATLLDVGRAIPVQASGAIAVGGCVIDVENGRVDLRLDVQLDSIERALTQPEV